WIDFHFGDSPSPCPGELADLAQQLCYGFQVGDGLATESGQNPVTTDALDHCPGLMQGQRRRPDGKVSDRFHENSAKPESHNRPEAQVLAGTYDNLSCLAADHLLHERPIEVHLGVPLLSPRCDLCKGALNLLLSF